MVGVVAYPVQITAAEDLNKEFVDGFYRLSPNDADVFLKVQKSTAQPETDVGLGVRGTNTNQKPVVDENDPSWIGKFLQLSIIFLLGLIIYLLSRRSRSRGRY
jgi:hypothetical protein